MKFKNLIPAALIAFCFCSCAKELIPSNKVLSSSSDQSKVNPNKLQGPCPYECHDTRCKAYQSGYCGADTPVSLQTQLVTSQSIKNTMISTFQNLSASGVNLTELSSELGLSHTITKDSIDFVNVEMTWDANNPGGEALTAPFKSNSNSNLVGYGFVMYTNGTQIIKPTIVKTYKNSYLKYFDLTEGLITTINNYTSSSFTFTNTYGNYIAGGGGMKAQLATGCGQGTANCMADAYVNHGWASVWISVQTAFIPWTAAAIAGACAVHNCILN